MVFNRRRSASPIKRDKHEITWSNLAQNASTTIEILLANTVDVGSKGSANEVAVGSHVKFLYLEFQFNTDDTSVTKIIHWTVEKLQPGQDGTIPSTYYQDQRSFVIQRGMEMLPKASATLVKRIVPIRVPIGYQRNKQGAKLVFRYVSSSATLINACGFAIYKELY